MADIILFTFYVHIHGDRLSIHVKAKEIATENEIENNIQNIAWHREDMRLSGTFYVRINNHAC